MPDVTVKAPAAALPTDRLNLGSSPARTTSESAPQGYGGVPLLGTCMAED